MGSSLIPGVSKEPRPSETRPSNGEAKGVELAPVSGERCGTCQFGRLVPTALEVVECRGLPPTPVMMGMTAQGPAVSLLYPNMPRKEEGCALWRQKQTVLLK